MVESNFLWRELTNPKQIVLIVMFLEMLHDKKEDTITIVAPGVGAHPLRQCFMNNVEIVHCLRQIATYDRYNIICLALMGKNATMLLVSCPTGRHGGG